MCLCVCVCYLCLRLYCVHHDGHTIVAYEWGRVYAACNFSVALNVPGVKKVKAKSKRPLASAKSFRADNERPVLVPSRNSMRQTHTHVAMVTSLNNALVQLNKFLLKRNKKKQPKNLEKNSTKSVSSLVGGGMVRLFRFWAWLKLLSQNNIRYGTYLTVVAVHVEILVHGHHTYSLFCALKHIPTYVNYNHRQ